MGRLLGIDYGDKRCGIALSDPMRIIASAHDVIQNTGMDNVVKAVVTLCKEKEVEAIVVGWPLNMDGTEGPSAAKVATFMDKLRPAVGLKLVRWDERMSTQTAEATLIEAGTRREKRKGVIDKVAAQVLLQHYLDSII